jgi:hypothetical protein
MSAGFASLLLFLCLWVEAEVAKTFDAKWIAILILSALMVLIIEFATEGMLIRS